MAEKLIMLDDGPVEIIEDTSGRIAVVLSDDCILDGNILFMPKKEVLSIASNMLIQLELKSD